MAYYGATAELSTTDGSRTVPLEDFFQGPGSTVVEQGEIPALIRISPDSECNGAAYLKLGVREALGLPSVIKQSVMRFEWPLLRHTLWP